MNRSAYTKSEIALIVLKHFLFCCRGLLWIGVAIGTVYLCKYLIGQGRSSVTLLIALIGCILSLLLIVNQLRSDYFHVRNKYAKHLYDSVCRDMRNSSPKESPILNICSLGQPTKEFFWDYRISDNYGNMYSYMEHFLQRNDYNANLMKKALTKNRMSEIMNRTYNYVRSIRIWKDTGLISFNYEDPLPISNLISFRVTNDPTYVRGRAITSAETTYRGKSYPSFFGTKTYRGKATYRKVTEYEPDRRINNFILYISIRGYTDSYISFELGDNRDLAERIKSELLLLLNNVPKSHCFYNSNYYG